MRILAFLFMALIVFSCKTETQNDVPKEDQYTVLETTENELLRKYTPFTLKTDISKLSDNQQKMIPLLVETAKIMNELFWFEAYGDKQAFLDGLTDDNLKLYANINYGPWDRLNGNTSFVDGIGEKPLGANFYPTDMTKAEFEAADLEDKTSLYTFLRRDEAGKLKTIPYHEMFPEKIKKASDLLAQAAELAEEAGLKKYLTLRSKALLDDEYFESDVAWMQMKDNQIDFVVGPIENYEDAMFGYKAAHEGYVLIKDMVWSKRLAKYAAFLPDLQKGLPCDDKYKQDPVGGNSELNAYDVVYYAGDCNAGSKTIAINLPNDEKVQESYGSRRLQLKNAMRAKFDKILMPISKELITPEQRKHITFDAFFSNTMFHEVAHGLGIKNTIDGKGTFRKALKEHHSALEEGKADILGLYMITQLHERGELKADIKDYYVTFMTSIFRSVRFGVSSSHGKANMIRFNFFKEKGAFERLEDGTYQVNFDNLQTAANDLSQLILKLQGDGDYNGVAALVAEKGKIGEQLQADLDRLSAKGIPVDVVFRQGVEVLGL